jgi:hypothetical protein
LAQNAFYHTDQLCRRLWHDCIEKGSSKTNKSGPLVAFHAWCIVLCHPSIKITTWSCNYAYGYVRSSCASAWPAAVLRGIRGLAFLLPMVRAAISTAMPPTRIFMRNNNFAFPLLSWDCGSMARPKTRATNVPRQTEGNLAWANVSNHPVPPCSGLVAKRHAPK